MARPPTFAYTVRKLARRNRVAFFAALAAVAFVLFITGFAITMTIQAQRISMERDLANQERQRAQKVSNIILNVFAMADPFQTFANDVSGSAFLDQAARSIEQELADEPAARARLLQAVGRAYSRRGEVKQSIPYLEEVVRVLGQMHGQENETLMALIDLSLALRVSGNLSSAREALVTGERLVMRPGMEKSTSYAKLRLNLGRVEMDEGHISEARVEFNRSLQLYRDLVGSQSSEVAEVLAELAATFAWTDDYQEAERLARQAIAIFQNTVPPMHPDLVGTEANLAEALYLQNRLDEAALVLAEVLRKDTALFGHNSPQVADVLDRLAIVSYSRQHFSEAEKFSRQAIATSRVAFGERHIMTAYMATNLSRTLIACEKYPEAEVTLRRALDILASVPDHQYTASAEYFLGEVLLATKRLKEAEVVLAASMKRWERSGAPHWRAMRSANALGEALYRQGRTKEGVRYLSESFRDLLADPKAEPVAKDKARERAARYLPKSLRSQLPSSGPLALAKR